jgi:hypothetical protein
VRRLAGHADVHVGRTGPGGRRKSELRALLTVAASCRFHGPARHRRPIDSNSATKTCTASPRPLGRGPQRRRRTCRDAAGIDDLRSALALALQWQNSGQASMMYVNLAWVLCGEDPRTAVEVTGEGMGFASSRGLAGDSKAIRQSTDGDPHTRCSNCLCTPVPFERRSSLSCAPTVGSLSSVPGGSKRTWSHARATRGASSRRPERPSARPRTPSGALVGRLVRHEKAETRASLRHAATAADLET